MQIGPSGISFRKPQLAPARRSGPADEGHEPRRQHAQDARQGGGGALGAERPAAASQGVFKQKAWLPWWLIPVAIALAALAVLLSCCPRTSSCPTWSALKSTFEAEKAHRGRPQARPRAEGEGRREAPPLRDRPTPAAGEKAEKGEQVTVEIAVGDGKITVPKVVGMTSPTPRRRCATRA